MQGILTLKATWRPHSVGARKPASALDADRRRNVLIRLARHADRLVNLPRRFTGWALLLGSFSPWLPVMAFERLIVTFQIRAEESVLAAKFGDEYAQYARRVNRWFGRERS